MRSATPVVAATTRRRRVWPASSVARPRCRRIEHCVAIVTSLMPAPAFSRDRTVVPSIRRRQRALAHAQPFQSSRHDYHSSTEARIRQVHPPTGSIVRTNRQQRSDHRPRRARVRAGRVAPNDRRDAAGAPTGARETAAAQRSGRRWICATARAASRCGEAGATSRLSSRRRPGSKRLRYMCRYRCLGPGLRRGDEVIAGSLHYIRSIIALPNPEQLTCVEPGIRRAKS